MPPISPLRYPGGKTKFANLVRRAMSSCTSPPVTFAEPFCGGAGVALTLLGSGDVQRIGLNDLDPLVAAFWKVIFGKTGKSAGACKADLEWLLAQVMTVQVTVDEWKAQKRLTPASVRAAAFKCLFLNRTSFNGILHQAGPIGGWGQISRKLDVRFNRDDLCRRILALWEMRDRVEAVDCEPWEKFISRYTRCKDSFVYLDPPYYHRAEQLYWHLFDDAMHRLLRNRLVRIGMVPWLLSYDDSVEVRDLYRAQPGVHGLVVDKTYSTHPLGGARFIGRELFFSNRPLDVAVRNGEADHSAVSVVGTLANVAVPSQGPSRLPIQGDLRERRDRTAQVLMV